MLQKDPQSCSKAAQDPQPCSTSHIVIPGPKATPLANQIGGDLANEVTKDASANLPIAAPQKEIAPSLPHDLHHKISLIKTQAGKGFAVIRQTGQNPYALAIGSKKLTALISEAAAKRGAVLRKTSLVEINDLLDAHAEQSGEVRDVWLRVAPIKGGVKIDLGDDRHTRIRITDGRVEVVESGSDVLFYRTTSTRPMATPAALGNWQLLKKYLNVHPTDFILLLAWITYTLAHPKVATSKYLILIVQGSEGSGKSNLCKVLIHLIDPSALGIQVFPQNAKDLAIAGQHAHILCFDNLRHFKAHMADMLCIAATGGTITTRQLYSDAEQQAIPLHVALILNGIHQFIEQPDLAQRCLPIYLTAIAPEKRKSEEEFHADLEADLPVIMRGLFDLVGDIFTHLPNVEISNPERMIDFVAWLAAMEKAHSVAVGVYQALYSHVLRQSQLDTLMANPLAAAIIEFMDESKSDIWSDTPSALLSTLNSRVTRGTQLSHDWPQNPIALSKRIAGLEAGLLSQGIRISLSRGKQRTITLSKAGV